MEDKIILTKKQALKIANIKDNKIHNFLNATFGVIGADYDIETFNEYLNNADSIEIGGEQCRSMNHALVIRKNKENYFFEHNEEKLKQLEASLEGDK